MRLRLALAVVAIVFVFGAAHDVAADTLERVKARGTMIFAAMPDALPQAGRDASGALTGFDIDVARELASRMGLGVSFETPTWQTVLEGDWKERWDLCVCSMTPTEEREKVLAFPAVYRMSPAILVVRKNNTDILAPSDASGKTVGVKADTTFGRYLARDLTIYKGDTDITYAIDNAKAVPFPDNRDAMAALVGGGDKLDAVITSLAHAQGAIAQGTPVRIVDGFLFFEPLAVATEKNEEAFGDAIAAAIESMEDDGTLSELSIKWFGIDLTSQ